MIWIIDLFLAFSNIIFVLRAANSISLFISKTTGQ